MALISNETVDPLKVAFDHFREIAAYQTRLTSLNRGKTEIIRYAFKRPGMVRMDFIAPFKGAALIYDPATRMAKLWPFGYGSFPTLTLSPNNSLIQSSTGQRVDRSDAGVLFENVIALREHGSVEIGEFENIDGHSALYMTITGRDGYCVGDVSRYELWLHRDNGFPVKVVSHGRSGAVIESVEMGELRIAPEFPADYFK